MSGGYWHACALHASVKLDLFSRIGRNKLTASQVANGIDANLEATEKLLNALCAMQLLIKSNDQYYSTTNDSYRYLCKDSGDYIGYIILHHHYLMHSWNRLDEAVTSGRPTRKQIRDADSARSESFLMGMFNLGMLTAPIVTAHVDFKGHRRLLDLGGGPCAFAIHFCRQYEDLKAVVFDLPGTEAFARRTIERSGVAQRLEFVPGDFHTDQLPGKFDVAWLSHILHAEGPAQCREILTKTVAALEKGAKIMIHEFILDDTLDKPLFPTLFNLNMLLGTEQGQAYSQSDLNKMLTEVGVINIRRSSFTGPSESGILIGEIPT